MDASKVVPEPMADGTTVIKLKPSFKDPPANSSSHSSQSPIHQQAQPSSEGPAGVAAPEGLEEAPKRVSDAGGNAEDQSQHQQHSAVTVNDEAGGNTQNGAAAGSRSVEDKSGAEELESPSQPTSPVPSSSLDAGLPKREFSLTDAVLGEQAPARQGGCWVPNKGDASNIFTFVVMVLGLVFSLTGADREVTKYTLAFGLFGFAGGVTNWLAVKMLFDRIPGLYGSGVIPRQFVAIRQAVKNMIMKMFFEREFLETYLNQRAKGFMKDMDLGSRLKAAMADPGFDGILLTKLEVLATKPEGMLVQSLAPMFGGIPGMVPMIKPFLAGFGEELLGVLVDKFDITEVMSIDKIQSEIDKLLTEKLQLITASMVKDLMEEVIRVHLHWLVIWGNVFGGLIGIVSAAVGYGG